MSIESPINQDPPVPPEIPEVVEVKDDKAEVKPRVFDIDKSWKEQLTLEEIKRIKNWAERVVKQWHDEVRPNYIFITETSAIPYGYVLKETWKVAYANEEIPKFHRIDPMYVLKSQRWGENYISSIKEYFRKIISKDNPRIVVFDEGTAREGTYSPEVEEDNIKNELFLSTEREDEGHSSFFKTLKSMPSYLEGKNPIIWGSRQVGSDILRGTKENFNEYIKRLEKIQQETSGSSISVEDVARSVGIKSRMPTTKPERVHLDTDFFIQGVQTEDFRYQVEKGNLTTWDRNKGLPTPGRRITGRIVKHPGQLKRAIDYVNDLQELGKEAGEELRVELEKEAQK